MSSLLLTRLRRAYDNNYHKHADRLIREATKEQLIEAVKEAEEAWNEARKDDPDATMVLGDEDLFKLEEMSEAALRAELVELLMKEG